MSKSQIGIAATSNRSDLKLQSAIKIATRIASKYVGNWVEIATDIDLNCCEFKIASGWNLKSLDGKCPAEPFNLCAVVLRIIRKEVRLKKHA